MKAIPYLDFLYIFFMAKKAARGRPKLPDYEKRDAAFLLKMTTAELALLREAGGDNLSGWARDTLLRAAERHKKKHGAAGS
ncbi:MAG TPA: hypothetical protein VGI40_20825 [Pirellulaceae bacterium]